MIIFFLARSLHTSTSKAYTWNINEYELAMTEEITYDEQGNIVDGYDESYFKTACKELEKIYYAVKNGVDV